MHRYKIRYFDFHTHVDGHEIQKAMSAEDAVFIWKTNNETTGAMKHFTGIESLEDKEDETRSPQR